MTAIGGGGAGSGYGGVVPPYSPPAPNPTGGMGGPPPSVPPVVPPDNELHLPPDHYRPPTPSWRYPRYTGGPPQLPPYLGSPNPLDALNPDPNVPTNPFGLPPDLYSDQRNNPRPPGRPQPQQQSPWMMYQNGLGAPLYPYGPGFPFADWQPPGVGASPQTGGGTVSSGYQNVQANPYFYGTYYPGPNVGQGGYGTEFWPQAVATSPYEQPWYTPAAGHKEPGPDLPPAARTARNQGGGFGAGLPADTSQVPATYGGYGGYGGGGGGGAPAAAPWFYGLLSWRF